MVICGTDVQWCVVARTDHLTVRCRHPPPWPGGGGGGGGHSDPPLGHLRQPRSRGEE